MRNSLNSYNRKRDFNKTKEPYGKRGKRKSKLRFVIQHHLATKDHFDLRLEWNGVLKSWAVPKGPSYNPKDKRLAIMVEDHPLLYRNFEGTIPSDQYGGGTVMLFDEGYWESLNNFEEGYQKGIIKFFLKGKRLKGLWSLVHFKEDNWLLIKEDDGYLEYNNIENINTSIRTGRTMEQITKKEKIKKAKNLIEKVLVTSPNKILFPKAKISKLSVVKYYQKVAKRMLPFLKYRIISTIRCPEGIENDAFYKKHFENERDGFVKIEVSDKENTIEEYYFITNINGLLSEVQMNSIEFHTWGSMINDLESPDIMVFDLDPDEEVSLKRLREGVRDLKSILDSLKLKSYLKTSGGKGYHVVVPTQNLNWEEFREIAKNIALLMEIKWPNKYTSNIRKDQRKGKIFIDWARNIKGSTSIAPYSLRARSKAPISVPLAWNELDSIKPNSITIKNIEKRLKKKDPWINFWETNM